MKTLIVQASFPRSASTLLVNILYGLIVGLEDQAVIWNDFRNYYGPAITASVTVFKTHETNLADLDFLLSKKYNTFFVCSERGRTFDDRSRSLSNVAVLDYNDLNNVPVPEVCERVHAVVSDMVPAMPLSIPNCIGRVEAMNRRSEEIADLPFSFVDPFYQLHGHHRLRGRST
jgi:hypothetical protein